MVKYFIKIIMILRPFILFYFIFFKESLRLIEKDFSPLSIHENFLVVYLFISFKINYTFLCDGVYFLMYIET